MVAGLADPSTKMPEGFIESTILRTEGCRVAKMPLAKTPCRITRRAEELRNRCLLRVHDAPPTIGIHHAASITVSTGQKARTRWLTKRAGEVPLEGHFSHGIQVRRSTNGIPMARQIAIGEIITNDQKKIGRAGIHLKASCLFGGHSTSDLETRTIRSLRNDELHSFKQT